MGSVGIPDAYNLVILRQDMWHNQGQERVHTKNARSSSLIVRLEIVVQSEI